MARLAPPLRESPWVLGSDDPLIRIALQGLKGQLVMPGMGALDALYGPDGFNVGWNLGRAAGAGITDHVHLHVVPRWSGDTNFMPVLADVKVLPEHLLETRDRLRAAWPPT